MPKKKKTESVEVADVPQLMVATPFALSNSIGSALRALRDQAAAQFVARAEMAEAVAVALAANEHVFVYGPPGTAKSSLLRSFASGSAASFSALS